MDIKFMLDTLQEEDKKKVKKIIETVQKKPHYYNKEALFMKKFILSLFKQYRYKKVPVKLDKGEPMRRKFIRREMPMPPTKITINPLSYAPKFINIKNGVPEAPSKL